MKKTRRQIILQRLSDAKAKRDAAVNAAEEEYAAKVGDVLCGDAEKSVRANPSPLLGKQLVVSKTSTAWPRVVLGLYEAERAIAKKQTPRHGEPSDAAYEKVGKFIDTGDDRVKALCKEGRQQIRDGFSKKPKINISIAEFKKSFQITG